MSWRICKALGAPHGWRCTRTKCPRVPEDCVVAVKGLDWPTSARDRRAWRNRTKACVRLAIALWMPRATCRLHPRRAGRAPVSCCPTLSALLPSCALRRYFLCGLPHSEWGAPSGAFCDHAAPIGGGIPILAVGRGRQKRPGVAPQTHQSASCGLAACAFLPGARKQLPAPLVDSASCRRSLRPGGHGKHPTSAADLLGGVDRGVSRPARLSAHAATGVRVKWQHYRGSFRTE